MFRLLRGGGAEDGVPLRGVGNLAPQLPQEKQVAAVLGAAQRAEGFRGRSAGAERVEGGVGEP